MSNFTTAAMNAIVAANDADDPKEAAAHRREADTYAKLDIADAIRGLTPNTAQDAAGCPQIDQQPEPGQLDGGKATEAGGGNGAPLKVHGRITNDGIAIDFGNTWVRADSIDVTMATSVSVRYVPESRAEKAEAEWDEAVNLSHRYRNEANALIAQLVRIRDRYGSDPRIKRCATHYDLDMLIDHHTPEG